MATTDEEQIEALKNWWKENGTSLIVGVAVVLVAFFGWRQWQSSQLGHAENASDTYQQLVNLSGDDFMVPIGDEEFSTMRYLHQQLQDNYGKSLYARFSALQMARVYVNRGDLDAAREELQWVLDNPSLGLFEQVPESLLLTARARLARVLLAQEQAEEALALITAVQGGEFEASYAEIEGDALLALGRRDEAGRAYQRATRDGRGSLLVELKLRDLGLR